MDPKEIIESTIDVEEFARDRYGLDFGQQGWTNCPFDGSHNNGDANPSLHLDRERRLIRCFSQGCFGEKGVDIFGLVQTMDQVNFLTALRTLSEYSGIALDGLPGKKEILKQRITATFDYQDEDGNLLYQILRKEPGKNSRDKDFVIRRPDGKGGWNYASDGVKLVPYRLPELVKTEGPIVIAEGEGCVDALWSLRIPATTNPFGAQKWRDSFNDYFEGRDVVVWPDNDGAGAKHAAQIGDSLSRSGKAASIRIVEPPEDLPVKGDIIDGLGLPGWTKDHVLEIIADAKPYNPTKALEPPNTDNAPSGPYSISGASNNEILLNLRSASELMVEAPDVVWQVQGLLAQAAAMVVVADAGVGKTWFVEELALSVDQGTPFLGEFYTRQGKVLVIDEENADALLKRRLQKLLRGAGLPEDASTLNIKLLTAQGINLSDENYVAALDKLFDEMRPDLVLIDALVRIHRGNENDAGDMARVFGIIKQWIVTYGCSFVFCHHRRKPGLAGNDSANMFRGSSEIRAFVDTHLDLKPSKNELGRITVGHSKSRFAEPLAAFDVEIVDVAEDATVVRYVGEAKDQAGDKLEEGQEFILNLLADGERHSRQDILTRGFEAKLGRDILDEARKTLVADGEVEENKEGRIKYVRLLKNVPSGPDTYIGRTEPSEENEPYSAVSLLAPEQLLTERQDGVADSTEFLDVTI